MIDEPIDMQSPEYTPERLLNEVANILNVETYQGLALVLECDGALISRVRRHLDPIGPRLMIRIMDRTDWSIRRVRELAGIPYDGAVNSQASQKPHRRTPEVSKDKFQCGRKPLLPDEDILKIKTMDGRQKDIARVFQISRSTVSAIKNGRILPVGA